MTQKTEKQKEINPWENNMLGVRFRDIHLLIPGLILVSFLTWLSIWLGGFVGTSLLGFEKSPVSPVMVAIILGITMRSLLPIPAKLDAGLTFSVKKILRLGIIFLGIRLSILDVFKLGVYGVPIVVFCIIGALLITTQINKWLKLPPRLGTLIAVGTSICGVSAIVAASPAIDADEEESAYAVAVITIFGLFATIFYPFLAHLIFNGEALKAGLFLGTSIHDTSQVVGAARIYADIYSQNLTLDVAMVTKLVRNVFMVLVIPFMSYYYSRQAAARGGFKGTKPQIMKLFPLFILGFLSMAALRSIGDVGLNTGSSAFGIWDAETWDGLITSVKSLANNLLVMALAGVGLRTNFRSFKTLGIKPFLVGLGASFTVGLVSYVAITLLGGFVTY
ncbi:MAG: putative sulfate exporter family transporter [Anaerolineaceae bacterium]|nr:putative sulfate exporter family transporter [Anaerolineaceae bacterium]